MRRPRTGTVYLLHFAAPIGNPDNPRGSASHYMGWTSDLGPRLAAHRDGVGAAIMRAVAAEGIGFTLARTWEGSRGDERQLKDRHDHRALCPVCRGHEPQLDPQTKLVDVERDLGLAELRRAGEARREELAHESVAREAPAWPVAAGAWGQSPEVDRDRGWAR